MKRKSHGGFSLLEGLLSMLMVMLVLAGLARTLTNSAQVRANRLNMDRAVEQLHLMNAMRADLMNSLSVPQPATTAEVAELRMVTVDASRSFRDRVDIANGPDSAFEAAEQIEIHYRLQDGMLWRDVFRPGLATERTPLTTVSDFTCKREDRMIALKMTFPYTRVSKTRSMKVELR